jgi:hypothetical protein
MHIDAIVSYFAIQAYVLPSQNRSRANEFLAKECPGNEERR